MSNIFCGIDPGLSGAVAFYRPGDKGLKMFDMPVFHRESGKKEINAQALTTIFKRFGGSSLLKVKVAVYEDVGAMVYVDRFGKKRGQGSASSFAFGKSLGIVIGILSALDVPYVGVHSSVWKSLLELTKDKTLSRLKAQELFPGVAGQFKRKMDDGRAEAALLAYFAAERFK